MFFKKFLLFFFFSAIGFLALNSPVLAGDPKLPIKNEGYAVKFVSQSENDPIKIEAGETKIVSVKFKNIGTKTWDASAWNYLSAYTVEPKYRDSEFATAAWLSKNQVAKIKGKVLPNEIGEIDIELKAPEKTGKYVERFHLASENTSWVKNGYFYFIIDVVERTEKPVTVETPKEEETKPEEASNEIEEVKQESKYEAKLFMQSRKKVVAEGGKTLNLKYIFMNEGDEIWEKASLQLSNGVKSVSLGNYANFADTSWKNSVLVDNQTGLKVIKGGVLSGEVKFRTPKDKGTYNMKLALYVNGEATDSYIEIPVEVTKDAPDHYKEPSFGTEKVVEQPRLASEPMIRVGLYKPEEAVQFISYEDDYTIFIGNTKKGTLKKGRMAVLDEKAGMLTFSSGDLKFNTPLGYFRLVPKSDKSSVFELHNYERSVTWKSSKNFNKYRGSFEYRYTQDRSQLYVINELLLEDYVAGIGETSNAAPMEYIKSLLTAARTYAYYIAEYSIKHDKRNFDVVAHTGDQLYLGYINEVVAPNVVKASQATRGYMITYDNNIVITPYYGNSDGRTRAWTEVWGGSKKPWLVSVPAVYDKRDGKRMFGHGVGMSQRDAAYRAYELEETWDELIEYYYTDVEIVKMYK
jgi:hypothetical protein